MTSMSKLLTGAAGLSTVLAVLAIASPAAAQQPYPYPNQNNGVVGAIVNAVTGGGYAQYPQGQYPQGQYGYGQYPQGNYGYGQVNERRAVSMCAAAAEQRIGATYRGQPGYNNGYSNNGYQQGYTNGYYQGGRVLGITNVERRNRGALRVSGVASSGRGYVYGNQGYNGQGYNNGPNGQRAYANQAADLRFTCKINARGQVSDVNLTRNQTAYRGY